MPPDRDDIRAVALLDEQVRRALYEAVVGADRALSRDEAAAAVGISRSLAAFHLDRLVAGGLLSPEYRRLSGRSGPGAGRPAKLYRPADREVAVTLPERHYERAAELFATTLESAGAETEVPPQRLRDAARDLGRAAAPASAAPASAAPASGVSASARDRLVAALRDQGYQPCETQDGTIRLANCPFHALVEGHQQLVCGMNLALIGGIVERFGGDGYAARPDPQPGWCCVVIDPLSRAGQAGGRAG